MKLDDGLFLGTAFTAGAIGLSLGAYIGSQKVAYDFLVDWQALIGGALAIVAALITVRQMRVIDDEQARRNTEILRQMQATDKEQNARHQDSMKVALRSEVLRVNRAFARAESLRSQAKSACEAAAYPWKGLSIVVEGNTPPANYNELMRLAGTPMTVINLHQAISQLKYIDEIADLFKGDAARRFALLKKKQQEVDGHLASLKNIPREGDVSKIIRVRLLMEVMKAFYEQCKMEIMLADDIEDLERFYKAYSFF